MRSNRHMHRLPLPLITTTLCFGLGGMIGKSSHPETVLAEKLGKPSHAIVRSQAASLRSMPPPFTSITASVDWVRAQMRQGNPGAAELLFRHDAGLTPDQRLALAKELVRDFRRYDPRSLARIVLSLPRGEESDRLLWSLIATWSGEDAEGVLHFIEALPADRLNTIGVLQNAAWGLCRLPADRVLAFAARLDEKGRAHIAEGLVAFANQAGSWRNTQAILDGLNVPPQKDSLSAEWRLGMQLGELAPDVLESRIAAEADVLKHDELLTGYAMHVGLHDPARGLELEMQIRQPEKRAEQITRRVEYWLANDRAAALAWLRSDTAHQWVKPEKRTEWLNLYHPNEVP